MTAVKSESTSCPWSMSPSVNSKKLLDAEVLSSGRRGGNSGAFKVLLFVLFTLLLLLLVVELLSVVPVAPPADEEAFPLCEVSTEFVLFVVNGIVDVCDINEVLAPDESIIELESCDVGVLFMTAIKFVDLRISVLAGNENFAYHIEWWPANFAYRPCLSLQLRIPYYYRPSIRMCSRGRAFLGPLSRVPLISKNRTHRCGAVERRKNSKEN